MNYCTYFVSIFTILSQVQSLLPASLAQQETKATYAYLLESKRAKTLSGLLSSFPPELIALIASYEALIPSEHRVTALTVLADKCIAIGYDNGEIHLYQKCSEDSVALYRLLRIFKGHKAPVNALMQTPSGLLSASTSYKHRVARLSLQNNKVTLRSFLATPTESRADHNVMLWDLQTGELLKKMSPKFFKKDLCFLTRWGFTFRFCVRKEEDTSTACNRTYNLTTGCHDEHDSFELADPGHVNKFSVSTGVNKQYSELELPNYCLVGCNNGSIVIQDTTLHTERTIKPHSSAITALCSLPAQQCFLSGAEDGSICMSNAQTAEHTQIMTAQVPVKTLATSCDNNGRLWIFIDSKDGLERVAIGQIVTQR
jgi:WD40 repeat protein